VFFRPEYIITKRVHCSFHSSAVIVFMTTLNVLLTQLMNSTHDIYTAYSHKFCILHSIFLAKLMSETDVTMSRGVSIFLLFH